MRDGARVGGLNRPASWFAVGVLVATIVQISQIAALQGNVTALLAVGELSAARPMIEQQLNDVTIVPRNGHDGQSTYLVARSLLGDPVTAGLLDDAGFRYRRILLPAIGSGFGLLPARATPIALAVANALSVGLCGAAMATMARAAGRSPWWALAGILAPGVALSLMVTTPDALALGLALTALAAHRTGRRQWTLILLVAAALTKEAYLLFAAGLALVELPTSRRRAATTLLVPTASLALWSAVVSARVGNGFTPRGNLGFPFDGLVSSYDVMLSTGADSRFWWWFTIAGLVGAMAVLAWHRDWRWIVLVGPWIGLALISSNWVWEIGNNAARAFAPLIPMTALAMIGMRLEPEISRARP